MRKLFAVLMLLVITAATAAFSTYAEDVISEGVSLRITLMSQEPDPAEPGSKFIAKFRVENIGGTSADDFVLEFVPEYPFTLYSGGAQKTIGQLGSYGDNAPVAEYVIRVDKDAVEGMATLKLRFKFDGSASWITKAFDINIRTYDAVMLYDEIDAPDMIAPGTSAFVKIILQNMADSQLRNIKAKLDFSDDELPFGPVNSLGEKSIFKLNPLERKTMSFEIQAKSDAESNLYKIPLTLSYQDTIGTNYEKTGYVSIMIGAKPELVMFIEEQELILQKTKGKIVVQLVNKGLVPVKFVTLKLNPSDSYDILSPDELYLGDIDSDDFETADFLLYSTDESRELKLVFTLEYSDTNNNKFSEQPSKTIRLYTSSEAKKFGFVESSSWRILGGLLLIVIMFILYRRFKRKKK